MVLNNGSITTGRGRRVRTTIVPPSVQAGSTQRPGIPAPRAGFRRDPKGTIRMREIRAPFCPIHEPATYGLGGEAEGVLADEAGVIAEVESVKSSNASSRNAM